jgi:hypothetical protein
LRSPAGSGCQHGRPAQPIDPAQDFGEQGAWHRDLGQLERDVAELERRVATA